MFGVVGEGKTRYNRRGQIQTVRWETMRKPWWMSMLVAGALGVCLLSAGGCGQSASQDNVRHSYAKVANSEPVSNLPSYLPQKFTPDFTHYPLIASKSKKIVHRRDCRLTEAIPAADREYFRGFRSAEEQGYKPCEDCRPDLP